MSQKRAPSGAAMARAPGHPDAAQRPSGAWHGRGDGLTGARVLCFESRRASQLCDLLSRHGATARSVAALREVALDGESGAPAFWQMLASGEIAAVVCQTGGAVRGLASALASTVQPAELCHRLQSTKVICRGPKPRAALRELGVRGAEGTEEPHTWREVVEAFDKLHAPVGHVAILEHGESSPQLVEEFSDRGRAVVCVPLYRWALPEDQSQLERAVRELASGVGYEIAVFTSGRQVDHVIQVASRLGLVAQLRRAARSRTVFTSVGPACSRALRSHGLPVDLEPEHPKMGHLVRDLAGRADELLYAKRGGPG